MSRFKFSLTDSPVSEIPEPLPFPFDAESRLPENNGTGDVAAELERALEAVQSSVNELSDLAESFPIDEYRDEDHGPHAA